MSDIGPVGRPNLGALGNNGRIPASYSNGSATPAASRRGDEVEFSEKARLLSKLNDLPDIRQGLVDRVKEEIANGTYEKPGMFDAAVEAMLDELA